MTLSDLYEQLCKAPSDINEHLPAFVEIAREITASRIIELGVREGVSTIGWLYALSVLWPTSGHLWSVDVNFPTDAAPVRLLDADALARWTFIRGRDESRAVREALPNDVDIVFIDTAHTLDQTRTELDLYARRVRRGGRIVLHDTLENAVETGYPVRTAIEEFCDRRDLRWTDRQYNNGLGIIEIS